MISQEYVAEVGTRSTSTIPIEQPSVWHLHCPICNAPLALFANARTNLSDHDVHRLLQHSHKQGLPIVLLSDNLHGRNTDKIRRMTFAQLPELIEDVLSHHTCWSVTP